MVKKRRALVTGASGFIGHHLVNFLKGKGYWVRGADIKIPEFEKTQADEFFKVDLRRYRNCARMTQEIDEVYSLAANMGGIGFIETIHAEVVHDNILINTNTLEAARKNKVKRLFFSSSACIYPTYKQKSTKNYGLKEIDAYPAECDNEYGWEKLITERQCHNYFTDYGLETRVARFHNIYGPLGTWQGGREKSPAAICRKIALSTNNGVIEVWGDGRQGRSYCYIDDCIKGIYKLMHSNIREPINIGTDRLVSINQLIAIVSKIAHKKIKKKYDLTKPQGVRGRNSDNTKLKKLLKWEPTITLEEGLDKTYNWIKSEIIKGKLKTNQ
jgi:GDP-D-mannose 3', 5'-epimerase